MYSFSIIMPSSYALNQSELILTGDYLDVDDVTVIVGEWYQIFGNQTPGHIGDFTNIGADNNDDGTIFQATGDTPTSWESGLLLTYFAEKVINPFYETNGITRELVENTKFARDKFNGQILVKGSDYDFFYTYLTANSQNYSHKFEFRVYKDSVQIYTGNLLMNGIFNTIEKLCSFNIETIDNYMKIIANQDVKYDIIKGVTPIVSCNVDTNFIPLEFSLSAPIAHGSIFWQGNFTDPFDFSTIYVNIYAREKKVFANVQADELLQDGWTLLTTNSDGTKTLVRDWTVSGDYATIPDNFPNDNILGVDYVYKEYHNITIVTETPNEIVIQDAHVFETTDQHYKKKSQYLGKLTGTQDYWFWIDFESYYGSNRILYTRLRRLDDVIQWIVGQMDSTIQFDATSFEYFDNNIDLANLLIAGITDIILNPNNTGQQDSPSTKGMLSFNQIVELFAGHPYHLYWYLEDIAGVYYFRLKHITEIDTLGTSQIDFTNLQSKNWCVDKGEFRYKAERFFGKIILKNTSGNVEFTNQEIDTNLKDVKSNIEKNIESFYFDVWDIQSNKSKYPNLSTDQFVLLSTEQSTVEYLTLFENSSVPYDVFTWTPETSTLFLQSYALTQGICQSNVFRVENLIKYKISFTAITIVGAAPVKMYLGILPSFGVVSNIVELEEGVLEYELICNSSEDGYLLINRESFATISTITLEGMSIKIDTLNCRKSASVISGLEVANADLSIANVLENHGKYEFPSTPVIINGVSTVVEVEKLKEQETIFVPIFDQNDIDFKKYVTTNLGTECEVESLTINFNEDFAQIKVKL